MSEKKARIEHLSVAPQRRILVIADVHGNLPYLHGVLEKAGFGGDDLVIFDGDFLEKGARSLDTLHYVMSLCAEGRAKAVCGNCDEWAEIFSMDRETDRRIRDYVLWRGCGLIWDMCAAIGRSPREEDIPAILDYLVVTAGETDFLTRYPEECREYTPEFEKAFIDRVNASDNEIMLLCLVEGKMAGNSRILWKTDIKTRHRANIGIALMSEYWNLGIGTKLFQEMIRIAEENEYILQLELDFIEGNARARALYEKMGFRITGVKPNAIRLKDGTLLNEYSMIREIRR